MLEILDAPDNVIAMRAAGTMDAADYDRIIEVIEIRLKTHDRIGVVADMTDFTDFTGEVLLKDLRWNAAHIGDWGKFPRCAMVTDKAWLRVMAQTFSPLIPGVEMRVFEPGRLEDALAWASGV
ncbi:STAS/SEC14 domain-containing protein [Brevundimonas sp.]|uniref:STAS/SEC14 domain-containing protein n=1 Tax=Brevundimonas sp. TaxID=1871086 RepID=UPI002FCCA378